MFRFFYPKGTDFSKLNPKLFIEVQEWMNSYPKKILNGLSSQIELQKFMGREFKVFI